MELELAPPNSRSSLRPVPQSEVARPVPPPPQRRRGYTIAKGVLDRAVAAGLLVATAPLLVVGWLLVRLTSKGPGFYSQLRVGLGGRTFRIYKLRSMYHNVEAVTGGVKWSTRGDSRVTPVGRVLRKLHIDELPQLWNVLVGDMSMVGPRPERPELVPGLAQQIPGYLERLTVPAGLTGLAQIQLPADSDLDSVRRKLLFDRCYAAQADLWLDLRLMAATGGYLAGLSDRMVRRMFALPDPVHMTETLTDVPNLSCSPHTTQARPPAVQ